MSGPDADVTEEPPRAPESIVAHDADAEPERRPSRRTPMPARAQRVLPIETCLGMYNDGRFKEVVSLGSAALQVRARMATVCDRPHEAAALYDLVGLSKQQLGDVDGARDAFLAAIHDAEPSLLDAYIEHLVALVGDRAHDAPEPMDSDAEIVRVRELRGWVVALDDALAVAPENETLIRTLAALREALSPACERIVGCVSASGDREEARALVAETLADEAMPSDWRERLCEQLTAASSAEIGQLTAQAIRSVQDGKDAEALEILERAERLAAALPHGAVAAERREEFERRLWWGYTKVGLRRCELRNFDAAVEPLFHALHLGGIDPDRAGETRAALVRALERHASLLGLARVDADALRQPRYAAHRRERDQTEDHGESALGPLGGVDLLPPLLRGLTERVVQLRGGDEHLLEEVFLPDGGAPRHGSAARLGEQPGDRRVPRLLELTQLVEPLLHRRAEAIREPRELLVDTQLLGVRLLVALKELGLRAVEVVVERRALDRELHVNLRHERARRLDDLTQLAIERLHVAPCEDWKRDESHQREHDERQRKAGRPPARAHDAVRPATVYLGWRHDLAAARTVFFRAVMAGTAEQCVPTYRGARGRAQ
jgi:tetratricopeptide (TPR) repeat protein